MRTAIWIYLFLFIAFFDLHAQYPILSPFALSLGAAPSFIGLIMGMYAITHIPGNILAGFGIDRYGSKWFIVVSLLGTGLLLIWQAYVSNPWQLLLIRSISGFSIAFLSPACLSLLARLAKDRIQQANFMSGNGLVNTLASVISPAVGALLVAYFGFTHSFLMLGIVLVVMSVWGSLSLPNLAPATPTSNETNPTSPALHIPWLFYLFPFALSFSQGILYFELPLMPAARASIMNTGLMFSMVSFGALVTLSMLFLNRFSPFMRTLVGSLGLALVFYGMSIQWALALSMSLFLIGMAKGVIYPALAAYLARAGEQGHYGKLFALLSVSYSLGAFFGPMMAGYWREISSPFFLAFLGLMLAVTLVPALRFHIPASETTAPESIQ